MFLSSKTVDHSIAVVRRYPEVKLYRDENVHSHAGMVVHAEKRILFISNPGKGSVVAVDIDSGRYSRTAREEYPIFSNRLPSFEYSLYECVDQDDTFVGGIVSPSGLALSADGSRLFIAERGGRIVAIEVESGVKLQEIDTGYRSIGGMAISPTTGALYFVDMDTNHVVRVNAERSSDGGCSFTSLVDTDFKSSLESAQNQVDAECGEDTFSLLRDYSCQVDGTIPNGTLFEQVRFLVCSCCHICKIKTHSLRFIFQVHNDGYASDDPDVQSTAGMDESAALLANLTNCEADSDLNFDALLLGGYYCHTCLPRNQGASCEPGGSCANVQWEGFTCDNEFYVDFEYNDDITPSLVVSSLHYGKVYPKDSSIELSRGVTYRFTVRTGAGRPVSISTYPLLTDDTTAASTAILKNTNPSEAVVNGPIILTVDGSSPDTLYLMSPRTQPIKLVVSSSYDGNQEPKTDDNELSWKPLSSGGVLEFKARSSASFLVACLVLVLLP